MIIQLKGGLKKIEMDTFLMKPMRKKGAGMIQGLVMGIAGLVIAVILAFVILSTLNGAGLLTAGSAEQTATDTLITNFTTGITTVSNKLPTVLLVAAVVLILGILVVLWAQYKRMQVGGNAEI